MAEKKPDRVVAIKKENNGSSQRRRRDDRRPRRYQPSVAKFKGETEGLEGHIYDIGVSNQSELFNSTTKKIAGYAGRNSKEAQTMRIALQTLKNEVRKAYEGNRR